MSSAAQSTLQVYERWARAYPPVPHNPLMLAEQRLMLELLPQVAGTRVLDLACGSGRYSQLMVQAGAAHVVALDFCTPMLSQVSVAQRVCASMMQLPFAESVFDCIVCGLGSGHAANVREWTAEVARVLRPGGSLLYSDFHPEAVRAGLTRSFKDEQNTAWTVPHELHSVATQREALVAAGLSIETVAEIRAGLELQESFPGSERFYRDCHGLPLVLVVRARK